MTTDRPSAAYLLSVVGGCLAATFTIFALGGVWETQRGHDPTDAIGGVGALGFAFSYTPLFVLRLIFWPRATLLWKSAARSYMTVFFTASILATLWALVLLAGPNARNGGLMQWAVLGAVCQVGAVVWLFRYRRL